MENENRLLRLPEVAERTSLSKATVYRLVGKNKFPAPVSMGARAVRWWSSEIEEWLGDLPRVQKSK